MVSWVIGVPPAIIHLWGFSPTKTRQLVGYPHQPEVRRLSLHFDCCLITYDHANIVPHMVTWSGLHIFHWIPYDYIWLHMIIWLLNHCRIQWIHQLPFPDLLWHFQERPRKFLFATASGGENQAVGPIWSHFWFPQNQDFASKKKEPLTVRLGCRWSLPRRILPQRSWGVAITAGDAHSWEKRITSGKRCLWAQLDPPELPEWQHVTTQKDPEGWWFYGWQWLSLVLVACQHHMI